MRARWWLGATLLAIAFSLRVPITSVGPVLDDVRDGVGLSSAGAGALTTLPLLCFAAAGAAVPAFARRIGAEAALLAGLLVLVAGMALRLVPELAPLLAGTLLIGVGIAAANVLLPVLFKRDFRPPGTMMGLYVGVMTGGAALAAALTVPLERALGSWQAALGAWGIPAALAAVAWVPYVRRARRVALEEPTVRIGLRHDRLAWLLTGLFAAQSVLFYGVVTWMAELLRDGGMSESDAGAMVGIFLLLGIPFAILAPILAARVDDQRAMIVVMAGLWGAGFVGLLISGTALAPLWMVLLGIAQGGNFALAMTLVVLRAPDGSHAAALGGMVQGIGYLLAAFGPLALGALRDATGGWEAMLWVMLGLSGVVLACGLGAARPGQVQGRVKGDAQRAY